MFTLPDTLWPLFFHNRHWLDALCRLAVDNLLYAGRRRGVEVGVFCAIHTYGRRLNWHPHIHVSVTLGDLAGRIPLTAHHVSCSGSGSRAALLSD
ncbi:ISPsy3, transposase [Pseudomonas savastanoi pv. glycinea str. race 4]|uniref:ISPsy3, transposase n=1 Tax=Pseudomonas savastanoi pv. glycinea str. race 4 TaxID=875330 RepID=F3C9B7_PSESG|nr:ISPsy3, transposase [Pseudomonas savastanoi pv. glycinea str. race 4]